MFALADWMNMKDREDARKQKFEKECNPSPISESLKKMKQNAMIDKKYKNGPSEISKSEKLFPQHQQSRNAKISRTYYR